MKIFRLPAWLLLLTLFVLTVVPAAERPQTGVDHQLEHFLPFAVLGAFFALGYKSHMRSLWLGGIMFAGLLELVQIPLPTRHARLKDFIVDSFAIIMGLGVTAILQWLWNRERNS